MNRAFAIVATAATIGSWLLACSTTDLVVGDDTSSLDGSAAPDTSPDGASPTDANTDAGLDAKADADAGPTACTAPATCIPSSEPCQAIASGATCASSNEICCAQTCPHVIPPGPTFCDGGPIAPLYSGSSKCIAGYACAPVTCAAGGGQCVAVVPGACASGHFGSATQYACGPGIGTGCCLP